MSLDDPTPLAQAAPEGIWPIDPDPRVTDLPGRQLWCFEDGRPRSVEVAGTLVPATDARIAYLGIRRDKQGRPFPAAFARSPETGTALGPPAPIPAPDILDIDLDSVAEVPLPSGVPALIRAGHPAALYLFQENLGAFAEWDGRRFVDHDRLPPHPVGTGITAGRRGIAYATADVLVSVSLPQLGRGLAHTEAQAEGLRFLSAPCWRKGDLLVLGERDGRLVLCRRADDSNLLHLRDLGRAAPDTDFAGPWLNRLGDAVWTGPDGFVACRRSATRPPSPPGPPASRRSSPRRRGGTALTFSISSAWRRAAITSPR